MKDVFTFSQSTPRFIFLTGRHTVVPRSSAPAAAFGLICLIFGWSTLYFERGLVGELQMVWEVGVRGFFTLVCALAYLATRPLALLPSSNQEDIPPEYLGGPSWFRYICSPRALRKVLQRNRGVTRTPATVLFCGGVTAEMFETDSPLREPEVSRARRPVTLVKIVVIYLSLASSTLSGLFFFFMPATPLGNQVLSVCLVVLVLTSLSRGVSDVHQNSRLLTIAPGIFRVEKFSLWGVRKSVEEYQLTENVIVVVHGVQQDREGKQTITLYLIKDTVMDSVKTEVDINHLIDCVRSSRHVVPAALDVATG